MTNKKIYPARIKFYVCCALTILFTANPLYASEPWTGKVTTGVNLRTSPGLDTKVITTLEKGDRITVRAERGKWFNVVIDKETYGFKGWVYGKFIRPVSGKKAKQGAEGGATNPAADKRLSAKKDAGSRSHGRSEGEENKGPSHQEEAKGEKATKIQRLIQKLHDGKAQKDGNGQTGKSLNQADQAEGTPASAEQTQASLSRDNAPSERAQKAASLTFGRKGRAEGSYGEGGMFRFILALSPLVLSCLALFLSYKAFRSVQQGRSAPKE